MLGRLRFFVLGAAAAMSVACGAPSTFDGLTGGSKVDASLDAPRPISPLSVTMVSTSRPRMKWELFGKGTGAVVELCKTRDFAPGTVKRYEADGRELVIPEDLEAGIWFWRLTARGDATVGTNTSPTWEVLVRGPAARGSSDAPYGAIADVDGDGRPDLVTSGDVQATAKDIAPDLLVFPGTADGTHSTDENAVQDHPLWFFSDTPIADPEPPSVAAGIDLDGDGFADLAYAAATYVEPTSGFRQYEIWAEPGGKWDPLNATGVIRGSRLPLFPGHVPTIAVAGDLNGDGYGDLLGADWATGYAALGGKQSVSSNVPLDMPDFAAQPGSPSRVVWGGFDVNGDGLNDLILGPASPAPASGAGTQKQVIGGSSIPSDSAANPMGELTTTILALGADGLRVDTPKYLSLSSSDDLRPKAVTSGDFDGDGLADLAAATLVDGAIRVCTWFANRDKGLVPGPCAAPMDGDTDFGATLAAADIEGDGKDDLLVTAKSGGASVVRVVHFGDAGADVAPIGDRGVGSRVTTIWPGRPGKARWAATGDDGASIAVYEAGTRIQAIKAPRGVVQNFGRALR